MGAPSHDHFPVVEVYAWRSLQVKKQELFCKAMLQQRQAPLLTLRSNGAVKDRPFGPCLNFVLLS